MTTTAPQRVAGDQLAAIVQRVERMHEEKKAIDGDLRDIYAEAKANGFDVKAIKEIVRLRRRDPQEVKEADAIMEVYLQAIAEAEGRGHARAGNASYAGSSSPGIGQDGRSAASGLAAA